MRPFLSASALFLAAAAAAGAQAPAPAGFVLGVHGMQTTERPDGAEATSMGGARLHLGYAPSRYIALFGEFGASRLARGEEYANGAYYRASSDAMLTGADIGLRLLTPLGRVPFTPYLTASAGARMVTQSLIVQDTVFSRDGRPVGVIGDSTKATVSGTASSVGGGLLMRLTPTLALDAAYTVGQGRYTQMTVESTSDGTTSVNIPEDRYRAQSASVGITWFPGSARRR